METSVLSKADTPYLAARVPRRRCDDQAIALLYRSYGAALTRYARRYLRSEADAEDVVQEVFIRICRRGELETLQSPSAVLFKTAFRLALNEIRRRRTSAIDVASELNDHRLAEVAPSPEGRLVAKHEYMAYCNALAALPPQCRRVVTLREIYGYSFKEIRDEMGLSISTLEKHMGRGKRLFKQLRTDDSLFGPTLNAPRKAKPKAPRPTPIEYNPLAFAAE